MVGDNPDSQIPLLDNLLKQSDGKPGSSFYQFKKLMLFRFLTENIFIFLLQYIGTMFSVLNSKPFLVWFASGTAGGFIFLRGQAILPGIFLGTTLAYWGVSHDLLLALVSGFLHTFQAYLLLVFSYRLQILTPLAYRQTTWAKFFVVAAFITAFMTPLMGYCSRRLFSQLGLMQFFTTSYLANLNGILVFATMLVTWDAYFPQIGGLKILSKAKMILNISIWLSLMMALLVVKQWETILLFVIATVCMSLYLRRQYGWCGVVFFLIF